MPPPLPTFVAPMLCQSGTPFDDPGWLFEVKWDGTRALGFAEGRTLRLRNRHDRDIAPLYPELQSLAGLPPGTIVDGEVVVLDEGVPSFSRMLQRQQGRSADRAAALARDMPALFVAFDCLYLHGKPVLDEPLAARREMLWNLQDIPYFQRSDGVVGTGLAFFDAVVQQRLEGVVAKRLDGTYRPGQRSPMWRKIKQLQQLRCAIVGWGEDQHGGLRHLFLATDGEDGVLAPAGRVGSGWTEEEREQLLTALRSRPRKTPFVRCPAPSGTVHWVESGLYCRVSFLERGRSGSLRGPVFKAWGGDQDPL